MTFLVHELIFSAAEATPDAPALRFKDNPVSYAELAGQIMAAARGLRRLGLDRGERVAVFLNKRPETVVALFGAAAAGGVFVPVNHQLRSHQVEHILRDCNVRILVTSMDRFRALRDTLAHCSDLETVLLTDPPEQLPELPGVRLLSWNDLSAAAQSHPLHRVIDSDLAAILYTSGSTGKPKGVVLSHQNMVTGAKSVAQYLENRSSDRILAALPLSFDYGLSQLTTAFHVGATAVLTDYVLPMETARLIEREQITGLAGVPPMWVQLARLETWPAADSLRYITNSGGAMPRSVIEALRAKLPRVRVYLMYGLTEAFRSTYLPPEEVDRRPDSMGKAIPNVEILVVRPDGSPCAPGEPGELVHRGPLVALGYWNDPERTALRFRPLPGHNNAIPRQEIAVFSGDTVRMDAEGFLYFVGRQDEMIKSSGYRVSPTEIEEVIYATGLVGEAVALGVPHPELGQAIIVVTTPSRSAENIDGMLMAECKQRLPRYMVPAHIELRESLPRNPNGKIDRARLARELAGLFAE